jgi:hypothetical protein
MAGERLASDHREDADDSRDDRGDRPDEGRGVDRLTGEEARLEEKVHASQETVRGG